MHAKRSNKKDFCQNTSFQDNFFFKEAIDNIKRSSRSHFEFKIELFNASMFDNFISGS